MIAWLKLNENEDRRAYSRGERPAATIHSWVLLRNQDMRILLLLTGCALATFHPSGAPAQSSSKLEELQKQLEASQKELEEANARILDLIRKPLLISPMKTHLAANRKSPQVCGKCA